jgi:hypothetical protein
MKHQPSSDWMNNKVLGITGTGAESMIFLLPFAFQLLNLKLIKARTLRLRKSKAKLV